MEDKLNLVEILRYCPKGMELDCTIYEGAELGCVTKDKNYPIKIIIKDNINGDIEISLTKEGYYNVLHNPKCVIFPKGKTTWEGFVPPCKSKKESEDEKIRKAIYNAIKYLETEHSWDFLDDVDILDAYAWLEKQGEKPQGKSE